MKNMINSIHLKVVNVTHEANLCALQPSVELLSTAVALKSKKSSFVRRTWNRSLETCALISKTTIYVAPTFLVYSMERR